jgi:SAM-dependent methyltransferase
MSPANPIVEAVLAAADPPPGAVVADLACGAGRCALSLAQRRPDVRVIGVDHDPAAIDQARAAAVANTEFAVMALEDLSIPTASVDAVVSVFGLFFVGDPHRSVAEAARILRPGGTISVATYADLRSHSLWKSVAAALDRPAPPRPGFPPGLTSAELAFAIPLPSFAAVWALVCHPDMFGAVDPAFEPAVRAAVVPYADPDGEGYTFPVSCSLVSGTLGTP